MLAMALLAATGFPASPAKGQESAAPVRSELFAWTELPPLPDPIGFAGAYAGVHQGALIVAGGANFPEKPVWDGGRKVWHDRIFILDSPRGRWTVAKERLPRSIGYGASASITEGVVCLGGSDADRHYSDAWLIKCQGGSIEISPLPSLPGPWAMGCGVMADGIMYLMGGLESPSATSAMHCFWSLDLRKGAAGAQWRELEPWPGPERHLSVAAEQGGDLFLFSGVRLAPGANGKPQRLLPYLTDAWRYRPGADGAQGQWRPLTVADRGVAAAPSPAAATPLGVIALFGGVDGSQDHLLQAEHPGFTDQILAYDPLADRWSDGGRMPKGASRVAAPVVRWGDGFVVVSGESRPGIRSPKMFLATPKNKPRRGERD